jgi:hypothetical protein
MQRASLSWIDRIALLISLLAFLSTAWVSLRLYEGMPHIEDEMAFTWQARVIERGQLTTPSPGPDPQSFLVPFVVDYHGQRFGKYPPGWPVVLALSEILGARALANPLLTGLAIWFLYRLVKKLLDERTALLTACLGAASPFVLMNGGALLSHPWSLLLTLIFTIAWLDAFTQPNPDLPSRLVRTLPTVTASLALGTLALTRPWTAVGVALPFAFHGLVILSRGSTESRKRLVGFGLLAGATAALLFAWQYAVTGNPLLNPYTLWWPYDQVGFGPGHGLHSGGYQPNNALTNTLFSLYAGNTDLFGWLGISWLFMPFGLIAIFKNRRAWLVCAVLPALVLAYSLYWMPSWVFGPRYYYEALAGPLLLTAAGIRWLAGAAIHQVKWGWPARLRFGLTGAAVTFLIAANLIFYLPMRLSGMHAMYHISSACLAPFQTAQARQSVPALVFVSVRAHWYEFNCLQDLNSPFMDSDYLTVISGTPQDNAALAAQFPNRKILFYYTDTFSLQETERADVLKRNDPPKPIDMPRQAVPSE